MYQQHPSVALTRAFSAKPFQGASPEAADFLFVGLDANYAASIEESPFFQRVLEYLDDGVEFWCKYGVHHPFLLPEYSEDGQLYHRSFSRIGFGVEHAHQVSFIELLHAPTCGRNTLTTEDLDRRHLSRLNEAIIRGKAKHVFIPRSVAKLMRETGLFPWLPSVPTPLAGHLGLWFKADNKSVYCHYHLSVYGHLHDRKMKQLREIAALI